jgi:Holliday junction resolvase
MATEQQIQSKRIKQLESEGYYVIKIIKANKNGLPDILALHPDKGVLFSEVKTPTGRLSKLQEFRLKELQEHGFRTEVFRGDRIDSDVI